MPESCVLFLQSSVCWALFVIWRKVLVQFWPSCFGSQEIFRLRLRELWSLQSAAFGDRLRSLSPMQSRAVLVCMWKIVIFCSKGKIGITGQFWSVAYAKRGRVILQRGSVLSLLGIAFFSNIFENFCSCKNVGHDNVGQNPSAWAVVQGWLPWWGPGEETSSPALPGQLWGAPLLLRWIALLSPASQARCHFAHKFSVYCWLSLGLAAAKRLARTLLMVAAPLSAAGPAGDAGRKHGEKNVSFKKNHQNNPHHSQTRD